MILSMLLNLAAQGPEHSSARLERFLQAVDEDPYRLPDIDESKWLSGGHLGSQMQNTNWAVVNCTTPANYFHVLRRQVRRLLPWAPPCFDSHLQAAWPSCPVSSHVRLIFTMKFIYFFVTFGLTDKTRKKIDEVKPSSAAIQRPSSPHLQAGPRSYQ